MSSPEKDSKIDEKEAEMAIDNELIYEKVERDLKSEMVTINANCIRNSTSNIIHYKSNEESVQSLANSIKSVDHNNQYNRNKDKALTDNGTNKPTEGLIGEHDLLKAYPQLKVLKEELDQIANAQQKNFNVNMQLHDWFHTRLY